MILDHFSRAEKYFNIHPSFKQAFDFVTKTNLHTLPLGKTTIAGDDIYIIIATDEARNERRKLETHRSYIDIQFPLEGAFPLEWHDVDSCNNIFRAYDVEGDVQYYNDPPLFTVLLIPEMFAILFPEDAHASQPPLTHTKKAIIKVAV
ncbi:MAG: YhcH/YjgK/YiaL family protein [Bacteroidota bacterium]